MDNATKIQAVLNTLELLNVPSTFDNVNKLLGIYQTLVQVRDSLASGKEVKEDAGEVDAE